MYVYKNTKEGVFAVGHYDPDGKFVTETVYHETQEASERVHYLNGGINPELFGEVIEHLYGTIANLNFLVEGLNRRLDRG